MAWKTFILAAVMIFSFGTVADAACTQEDIMEKAQTLVAQMTSYAEKNADNTAFLEEYQKDLLALSEEAKNAEDANNFEAACTFYDKWIEKTK